ncbi:carbon-nitrogen hydrolase family protein [Actinophytocola algeriensis]|uniref:Nitrilase n=1 Tax=Actinophytocola algeriensis TaxID=1768010 RepID=A0A7W7Q7A0_9PSEU|nr:carbon-nitrogen hydrolase family protein [Actinophytocola algeriensis]MBB4908360.1 nitrilase [Actinophytocola algeriensis]MBE1475253.1 nitrilase [Actinophytocola algeriensis]
MTKVAVVQAAPSLFDTPETLHRFEQLLGEATSAGAELIVFPEAFVGGYPKGATFGATVGARSDEGRALFARYRRSAIDIPGPDFDRLRSVVGTHKAHVVVGVIERAGNTLYCASLLFAPDGTVLGHHRKLVPTGAERLIWGQGDASDIAVIHTDLGRIGMAICWENYMPLYRSELYRQGVQLYVAPTVDSRDTWASTMRHIAVEGRCFALSATQYAVRGDYPADFPLPSGDASEDTADAVVIRGGSCVVDPYGALLTGPVFDRKDVLVTDIDMDVLDGAYLDLDVSGHYARPDLFWLATTQSPRRGYQ